MPMSATKPANAARLSIQPGNGCSLHADTMLGRTIVSGTSPRSSRSRCSATHFDSV